MVFLAPDLILLRSLPPTQ